MTVKAKRKYLESYRLQQAKIARFNFLMEENPERREIYLEGIRKARELRARIEEEIERIGDDILSEILSQKYLCGKKLMDISYNLNYSVRQIERLHLKALEKFAAL